MTDMTNSSRPDDRIFHPFAWMNRWRAFALLFAIGGSFLGIFGLPLLLDPALFLIPVPGYIVTTGYFWRGLGNPGRKWTCRIWSASLVVQGAWLLILVFGAFRSSSDGNYTYRLPPFPLITTVVSAAGLWFDPGEQATA